MPASASRGSGSRVRSAAAAAARSAIPAFTRSVLPDDGRDGGRGLQRARYERAGDRPDRQALGGAGAQIAARAAGVAHWRGEAEELVAEVGRVLAQCASCL